MQILYQRTVTIWNHLDGGTWERETWYPTVIRHARLMITKGNARLRSGLETADSARLHISDEISEPDKPYTDPISWKSAPSSYYTLDAGSFFTDGDTSSEASDMDNFFEHMERKYPLCFRISTADRFEVIPHFEVFGR